MDRLGLDHGLKWSPDGYTCLCCGMSRIVYEARKKLNMDQDSPFAAFSRTDPIAPTRQVYVNFCETCHHVWKAPAIARQCINCTNPGTVRCLVQYETEFTIT